MRKLSSPTPSFAPIGCDNESNRHGWVRAALQDIPAGGRILDAGAGTQRYREYCTHLVYVSQDFGKYDGTGDSRGLQTGVFDYGKLDIISDITAIPTPDDCFDAVLCTEVLEHVPLPEDALRELVRVLKPGGRLILTAPFVSFTHVAPYHYCTGFNRYFFQTHLEALGMEIIELATNGGFFDVVAQEIRRVDTMAQAYTGGQLTLLERLARRLFLRALARFREADKGSTEFACYGLHVIACKRLVKS
jgi:SAM-dependent methyltransferase